MSSIDHLTTRGTPKRQMRETLYIRHRNIVEPMMVAKDRKVHFKHSTLTVNKAVNGHERNAVLDGRPLSISNSENDLTMKERSTRAQLRFGYCGLLGSYKSRIKKDSSLNVCADCCMTPH